MDLGFNLEYPQRTAAARDCAGDSRPAPEWHEWSSRLFAGWAARRELLGADRPQTAHWGNFDPASAGALSRFVHASRDINQSALGNRKPDGGIGYCLAGISQSGDRG
jgi:hypothetical protein